jgi:GTP-binding protein
MSTHKAAAKTKKGGVKSATRKRKKGDSGEESAKKASGAKGQPWDVIEAEFVFGAQTAEQLPAPLTAEIAFAGRSNVGKSSLMNALLGRRNLVRTSSTPGCTRQINFFDLKARDGSQFRLVDLPGYGYAKRSKSERSAWAELIEAYLTERDVLRAVVVLVDARRGLEEDEAQLIEFVRAREISPARAILVATKIDKLPKSQRKAALARLAAPKGIAIYGASAITGDGIDALWKALRRASFVGAPEAAEAPAGS